ncbi:MAG: DUF1854 domain-containing protein [Polaromonas sp.]|uniref:cyanophycin metabolism-associated DUF1854 family protein n=1 Tax=Polaromonas sp. TaxID=1869339 RepID=UPI0024887340|nr:DUF1854 domain-containing protein [Polaromonas sp.]MDI1239866.1 DUF1854 domain-containing protein [Polaromonas sp.]MDI1339470.1 DUF1854 domain-containing protein [Polaromonas sp.]
MTIPPVSVSPAFQLERHASGQLLLVAADGEQHLGVVPVRAFPIAAPEEGISLISSEGHELAWLERLGDLPLPQRSLLEEELALRDFVPEITRLISVSSFGTPSTWAVETDRGETSFVLKGEEDIRRLSRESLLIAAGHGVHFSVKDMGSLDRASRRLLERFL